MDSQVMCFAEHQISYVRAQLSNRQGLADPHWMGCQQSIWCWCLQVVLKDFQHAAKAQRASVTPADILRYEEYNERHGAKYVEGGQNGAVDDDEDDDW